MSGREPDVEMRAKVRARELTFERVPDVVITAHANARARADVESQRDNLPASVEPGVTYRDVEVRWRAWARLEDPPDLP